MNQKRLSFTSRMQSCPRPGAGIFPLSLKRAVSADNVHINTASSEYSRPATRWTPSTAGPAARTKRSSRWLSSRKLGASFDAGGIVSQVMSFGSPTPIEVAVQGPNLPSNSVFAVREEGRIVSFGGRGPAAHSRPVWLRRSRIHVTYAERISTCS